MLSSRSSGGFAFDTAEAVLQVLASIRTSEATTNQKNELRDLVLSYTNGGKDPSVQIQITQKLQSLGVVPVAPKVAAQPAVVHEFGSARNVPTFHPGAAPAAVKPVATPIVTTAAPAVPTPPPVPLDKPVTSVTPVATPPTDPVPALADLPTPPTPTPTSTQTPAPTEPVVPPLDILADVQSESALNRVREIKSLVNQQVGNPVNLVDINNEVGREYMSSLLNAMKQLNSGVGVVEAMVRLEAAYVQVENLLKHKDQPAAEAVVTPEPIVAPAEPPAVAQPVVVPTPTPTPQPTPQPVVPPKPQPAPERRWSPEPVQPTPVQPPKSESTAVPISTPTPAPSVAPVPQPTTSPVRSINASATPLKSIDDLPTAASLKTSATGDPLMTTEVTNGLNQLLSDWMLFKKSGLFGTGPKGIEHPLYAKIKDLQIPLLLAGRFEGATQEIKQSVTDYMNGWRYEQGIIYEQGETFDHYLRRVIRHILDLQK